MGEEENIVYSNIQSKVCLGYCDFSRVSPSSEWVFNNNGGCTEADIANGCQCSVNDCITPSVRTLSLTDTTCTVACY